MDFFFNLRRTLTTRRTLWLWVLLGLCGLFLYLGVKPLLMHLVLKPNLQPKRPGLRLELSRSSWPFGQTFHSQRLQRTSFAWSQPDSLAEAWGFWLVKKAGVYQLRLQCDDAGQLWLDQDRLIATWGMHRANGGNARVHLEPGPHFLRVAVQNAPLGGNWEVSVQGPGQAAHRVLGGSELAVLELGNLPFWLGLRDALGWLGLLLLAAGLLGALRPWLSAAARRVLPLLLPGKSRLIPIFMGLAALALTLGAWPLIWHQVVLPSADPTRQGLMVREYLDRDFGGGLAGSHLAPKTALKLDRPQSSLRAWALWQAPQGGALRMRLRAENAGGLRLDRCLALMTPERPQEEARPDQADICVTQGPHLLELYLNNYDGEGRLALKVHQDGRGLAPLDGQSLVFLDLPSLPDWLGLSEALEYLGLWGLAWALVALAWSLAAPAPWKQAAPAHAWPFLLAGLSWAAFLALALRVLLRIDMAPPAQGALLLAGAGLTAGLAALLLAGAKLVFPGKKPAPWAFGLAALSLLALAGCLRLVFLTNVEYQQDEQGMWHLAINLVRDHIPYLTGNISSKGTRNPPAFLYLLGLPAALGRSPWLGGLFTALLNTAALGLTLTFVRRHLGSTAALISGLLLACSPWAIRYSMNIWPQNCLFFFAMALLLLLPAWSERGGAWRSLAVGLCASLLVQLHFTGGLLLAGLILSGLVFGIRPKKRGLPLALAGFLLPWLPYLYYLFAFKPSGGEVLAKMWAQIPGESLGQLFNLARLMSDAWLSDPGTIGHLFWQFRALVWPPLAWPGYVLPLLAAGGLYVFAFRLPSGAGGDKRVDWFRVFFWAAFFALLALTLLNEKHKMHYVEFLLPWPMIMVGLWVQRLERWPQTAKLRRLVLAPVLILLILLACLNAGYFWSWQSFIARSGGGGEYNPPFFRVQARESCLIQTTRPLPDRQTPRAF